MIAAKTSFGFENGTVHLHKMQCLLACLFTAGLASAVTAMGPRKLRTHHALPERKARNRWCCTTGLTPSLGICKPYTLTIQTIQHGYGMDSWLPWNPPKRKRRNAIPIMPYLSVGGGAAGAPIRMKYDEMMEQRFPA